MMGFGVRTGIALRIGTGRALRILTGVGFVVDLGVGEANADMATADEGNGMAVIGCWRALPRSLVASSRFASFAFTWYPAPNGSIPLK
jgi:hypothetical protein